jgi:integrase
LQPPSSQAPAAEYLTLKDMAGYCAIGTRRLRDHLTDPGHPLAGLRSLTVRSREPEAFVFGQEGGQGNTPLSSMEMHRRWRRALAKARVRYRVPEQLRHTFASTMLSRNAPVLYVQHQGGWRSASVLLHVYARWLPQAAGISALAATLRHQRCTDASPSGASSAP